MTITYRLIGKGTTDENGIAHMDYSTSDGGSTWTDISSNPGYTGVGAGEIDLLASTDNPITAGSCQSEPYPITDAKAKCGYINKSSHCTATLENDVLTLGTDGTDYGIFYFAQDANTSYNIEVGDTVEFVLMEWSGTTQFRLDGTSNTPMLSTTGDYTSYLTGNNLIRIKNNGTSLVTEIDGVERYTRPNTISETRKLRIRLDNGSTAKIKNLIYYPI